jgi:hypothetical protein
LFQCRGGRLDAVRIRDVALQYQCASTGGRHVTCCAFEPGTPACEQADTGTSLAEGPCDGAADTRRGAGNHHDWLGKRIRRHIPAGCNMAACSWTSCEVRASEGMDPREVVDPVFL